MIKFAFLITLEAKPGKENEVNEFLKSALQIVDEEPDVITWYALKRDENKSGFFHTFTIEENRKTHLSGKTAKALIKVSDLFVNNPLFYQEELEKNNSFLTSSI